MRNVNGLLGSFLIINVVTPALMGACPTPPTAISPELSVKSSFDKKTSLYTYTYNLSNGPTAKTVISRFMIAVPADTQVTAAPVDWNKKIVPAKGSFPAYAQFSSGTEDIAPRAAVGGFSLTSKMPPGLVQYFAEGDPSDLPKATTVNKDDEVPESCPGFYYSEKSVLDEMPTGQTQGPVSSSQVELKIFMKLKRERPVRNEDDENENLEISSTEKGVIEVVAFPTSKFDLTKTDLASIRFGPGKAAPTKAELVSPKGWPASWRRKADMTQPKLIVLEFKLSDLQIRCDVDHSLFLTATAGASQLIGSSKVRPVTCSKEIWRQMGIDRKWPKLRDDD